MGGDDRRKLHAVLVSAVWAETGINVKEPEGGLDMVGVAGFILLYVLIAVALMYGVYRLIKAAVKASLREFEKRTGEKVAIGCFERSGEV